MEAKEHLSILQYQKVKILHRKMSYLIGLFCSEFCFISARDGINFPLGTLTGFLVTCGIFSFHKVIKNALIFFLLFR